MTDFEKRLSQVAYIIQQELSAKLDGQLLAGEIARPQRLMEAMRHGALNGGKRLRPFLVIESAGLFGVSERDALRTALALECVHCYSLIHDDLPAMDDDDLRRGQPTVHIAFDEAAAILAGDSLLSFAFDLLADPETHFDPAIRSALVLALARASGHGGMAGGQMLDLEAETLTLDEAEILRLQSMKTGALLRFAGEAGAILGGASNEDRLRLAEFGRKIGQAFQLTDDILDVTSTTQEMGKKVAKDAAAGKGTLVSLWGLDKARKRAGEIADEAEAFLEPFGDRAEVLKQCARYIVERGK
ncbi:MAG: polyprenyl synthetase family protein [Salaquimonas sp.]